MEQNTIRNQIWEAMKTAYTYSLCIQRYNDRKRKWNRRADCVQLVIGFAGGASFFYEPLGAFISTLIMTLISFAKQFVPALCQPESELTKLDEIMEYYESQCVKISSLWNKYEDQAIDDTLANKSLEKIKSTDGERKAEMNKLIRSLSKKENSEIEKETDEYLKRNFYNN